MRIRVLSDLHLEFAGFEAPAAEADVVVIAGDVVPEQYGIAWARVTFPNTPIVYVAGNHEFYGADLEAVIERMRDLASRLGVTYLERDEAILDGVRFLGTTLWTDFCFNNNQAQTRTQAEALAREQMSDFRVIRYRGGLFQPEVSRDLHLDSRAWLASRLEVPYPGTTIVVTHHLPHRNSVNAGYAKHPLNPAFVSHMPELVRAPVDLWIHGHTHSSVDYVVNGTRVVCNPRGYGPHDLNKEFDPALVVEIQTDDNRAPTPRRAGNA